ncbi:hypothetical protein Fmac_032871 [Flemingia macrophylla]|uniref:Uncharacterized protein n=1 Tax=Flemingia macrophylla TaxID=520843 RepID=A0ABD1L7K0_9FABA
MSIPRLMPQTPIADHHKSRDKALEREEAPNSLQFNAINDAIVIRGVHDVAADTSAETRKLEGKLDAFVNLVTQLAANQKPVSVAKVCGIHSSNDHHTNKPGRQVDALVNLVTQLAANQKPVSVARVCGIRSSNDHNTNLRIRSLPLLQESEASVLPMTIILVSVLLRSNLEWMSILRPMLQTPIVDHHSSRDKAINREYGSQLLALEGKLDALVNLVTQLAANQKQSSVARVCGIRFSNDQHTSVCPSLQQSGLTARNDAIVIRGVHVRATDTSAKTRKLEGKLDALVNLVTQLAANQKPASIARVYGTRSSDDNHTSVYLSSQQSGVDEHHEAYAANTYSRPP